MVKLLLAQYPTIDIRAMGFSSGNWQDEPLWSLTRRKKIF